MLIKILPIKLCESEPEITHGKFLKIWFLLLSLPLKQNKCPLLRKKEYILLNLTLHCQSLLLLFRLPRITAILGSSTSELGTAPLDLTWIL